MVRLGAKKPSDQNRLTQTICRADNPRASTKGPSSLVPSHTKGKGTFQYAKTTTRWSLCTEKGPE